MHNSGKSCTFALQTQNDTTMIATPVVKKNTKPFSYNPTIAQPLGLTEIHETQLIDPHWRNQPMRHWDDVYDDLCREVGSAYGLNDIREA